MIALIVLLAGAIGIGVGLIVGNTTAPGNPGARLWEQQMQDGKAQPAIPNIAGGPNNVVFAPVGAVCTDDTGKLWVKQTDSSLCSGWEYATLNPVIL